jgi:pimeloyl-ACP methyl ester carboxylesterase
MRACIPDSEGKVDRDGIGIHYEIHGSGDTTLLLIPPAPITHSRIWKAQIPFLARHYRVVTFDGRGNGRSGRPTEKTSYTRAENVADIVAVLDATATKSVVLIAHCHANWWAIEFADLYPERVDALIAIDPGVPYLGRSQQHWVDTAKTFDEVLDDPTGWELFNRHVIVNEHHRWVEFFFGAQLVERHSTKQFEDAVSWALESSGEVLVAAEEGIELDPPDRETFVDACRNLNVPVLVIHGSEDVCQAVERGREFADLTNGEYLEIEGAGHLTIAREPVKVNRAIKKFTDRMGSHR